MHYPEKPERSPLSQVRQAHAIANIQHDLSCTDGPRQKLLREFGEQSSRELRAGHAAGWTDEHQQIARDRHAKSKVLTVALKRERAKADLKKVALRKRLKSLQGHPKAETRRKGNSAPPAPSQPTRSSAPSATPPSTGTTATAPPAEAPAPAPAPASSDDDEDPDPLLHRRCEVAS